MNFQLLWIVKLLPSRLLVSRLLVSRVRDIRVRKLTLHNVEVPKGLSSLQNSAKLIHNLIHNLCTTVWTSHNEVGRGANRNPLC